MTKHRKGKPSSVRRSALMNEIIDAARDADGIKVADLRPGDELIVRTKNSVYTFRIVDPAKAVAMVSGGRYSRPHKVTITGSSLSGTGGTVRVGWIGAGFRLAIGARTLLSSVVSVDLNGHRILPAPEGNVH